MSELLWFCDTHSFDNVSALYTFPTNKQMKDFVKARIRPEFAQGYYATLTDKNNNSLDQMSVRNSRIYFRSASKGSAVEGVDIDMLSLDEYDRLNPTAEISAMESLSSSKYGLIRRWSTPTIPNYGIHKKFLESDQRMWVHTCPHCGYEQVLDYEKNIVCNNPKGIDEIGRIVQPGTFSFVCQKCGGILDRWYDGQWVAMAPSIGRAHGYQISQLDAVWVSADDLKRKELQAPSKQFFYNYVIGKPYEDSTSKFYDSDVLDHRRDYLPEQQKSRGRYDWISAGIDWGEHFHHVVIMGMLPNGNIDIIGLKAVRRSEGVNELERDLHQVMAYLDQFNPDLIVPDFGYNGNYNDKLSQAFGTDKVYSCIVKSAKSQNDYKAHFDLSNHRVTIDKLMQNVMMLNNMKRDSIGFYKKVDPALKLFMQHWSNVVIRTDIDDDAPDPDTIVKTITRKDGDHYAQSSVYAMVGMNHLVELIKQRKDSQLFTSSLSTYTKVPDSEKTDLQEELFNSSLV